MCANIAANLHAAKVGWLVCPREPSALPSTIENRDLLSAQVLQRDSEELATRLVPDGSISRES